MIIFAFSFLLTCCAPRTDSDRGGVRNYLALHLLRQISPECPRQQQILAAACWRRMKVTAFSRPSTTYNIHVYTQRITNRLDEIKKTTFFQFRLLGRLLKQMMSYESTPRLIAYYLMRYATLLSTEQFVLIAEER